MKVVSFDRLLSIFLLLRSQPKERVGIVGRCAGDYFHLFVHLFEKSAIFFYNSGSTTGMEEKRGAGRGERRQLAKALRPSSLSL